MFSSGAHNFLLTLLLMRIGFQKFLIYICKRDLSLENDQKIFPLTIYKVINCPLEATGFHFVDYSIYRASDRMQKKNFKILRKFLGILCGKLCLLFGKEAGLCRNLDNY